MTETWISVINFQKTTFASLECWCVKLLIISEIQFLVVFFCKYWLLPICTCAFLRGCALYSSVRHNVETVINIADNYDESDTKHLQKQSNKNQNKIRLTLNFLNGIRHLIKTSKHASLRMLHFWIIWSFKYAVRNKLI